MFSVLQIAVPPIFAVKVEPSAQFEHFVAHEGSPLVILFFDEVPFFRSKFFDAPFHFRKLCGFRFFLYFFCRARFVEYVDRFIGKKALGDITSGKFDDSRNHIVIEYDAVKILIAFFYPFEYAHRVVIRRFFDFYRLETAFERGILFNVAAVFFCRRRTDDLYLAPSQCGLEHIRCVHRPFRASRADDRMQFVDK